MHTTSRAVLFMAALTLCALPATAQNLDLSAGIALPHYQYNDRIGLGYTVGGGVSWNLSQTLSVGGLVDVYVQPEQGWTRTNVSQQTTHYQGQEVVRYDTNTSLASGGFNVTAAVGARLMWEPFGRTGTVTPYLTMDAVVGAGASTAEPARVESRSSIPEYSMASAIPRWSTGLDAIGATWGPGAGVRVRLSEEVQVLAEMRYYGVFGDGVIPIRAGLRLNL